MNAGVLARPGGGGSYATSALLVVLGLAGLASVGFLVAHGAAVLIVVGLVAAVAPIALANSPLIVLVGLGLPVLVPVPSLVDQQLGPLPMGVVIGLYLAYCAGVVLTVRRDAWQPDRAVVWAVLVVGLSGAVLSAAFGFRVEPNITLLLVWGGALGIGAAVAGDARAIRALVYFAVPIAALAIIEAVGFTNPWTTLFGPSWIVPDGNLHRSIATFGHPLVAGSALMAIGLLGLTARVQYSALVLPIIFAGSAMTVSRSAIVGALVFGLVALSRRTSDRGRILALGAAGVVLVVVALALVPAFKASVTDRVVGGQGSNASVRQNAISIVSTDATTRPWTLALGKGLRSNHARLEARGGNAGYATYDNQYITLIYDAGVIALAAALALIVVAVQRSRQFARFDGVPVLVAYGAMLAFFDGLYWPATGALFFFILGTVAAHPRVSSRARDLPMPRMAQADGRAAHPLPLTHEES